MTVSPDLRLADRYTLLSQVASGGMGEVWRARDEVLGRTVAVKVLRHEFADDESVLRRFREEARNTALLSAPGIANVFDYGEAGGIAFLVMEFVDGEPLSAVLRRDGPLPPGRAMQIVGEAALALQAAHAAGVVHRDVKPSNILIRPDGSVKVTDFGIARALDSAPITRTGVVLGTAHYMSPEQASGEIAGPASDVYSLGVVSYECLTGNRPFQADSAVSTAMAHIQQPVPQLPPGFPDPLNRLVSRALAKEPDGRFGDAGEFGRRCLALAERYRDLPTPPAAAALPATDTLAQPTPTRRLDRVEPSRRKVRAWFIAIAAAVVIAGFFGLRACATTAQVRIARVVGLPRAAAVSTLTRQHLDVAVRTADSRTVPAGRVISQAPAAGTLIDQGARVTLTVSAGPPTVQVDAARYVGQPYPQVRAALQALGLSVKEIIQNDVGPAPTPAPDTVLQVAPTGPVPIGATVTVTVAEPPAPAPPAPGHHHHGDQNQGNGD
jgi:tRNA A-37 threonylcarbamoyl transferase component Bud32